jgi:outer membrane protein assembly factor BamA
VKSYSRILSAILCAFAVNLLLLISQGFTLHAQDEDEEEGAKYQPYRDYGADWRLGSLFGLTPEDGVLVGTGAIVYKFGFRTFPYIYRMELVGGLTLKTGRFKVKYTAKFPDLGEKSSLDILAYASELEVRNFYGYGNNKPRNEDSLKKNGDYYRVASRQYFIQPTVKFELGKIASLGFAASFKHFEVRQKPDRFYTTASLDSLGDDKSILGAGIIFELAFSDASVAPREGFLLGLSAWNYPNPFRTSKPFQRYVADLRGYVSGGPVTAALRVSGEKVDGEFPFYEAAFLGGANSLRGYDLNRFSGDASLAGSAELRLSLFRLKLLVPTQVGVFFFGDAGRVYVEGNSPGGWHADVGGGISLAPVSRDMTLSISIASSVEGLYINGGFGFSF